MKKILILLLVLASGSPAANWEPSGPPFVEVYESSREPGGITLHGTWPLPPSVGLDAQGKWSLNTAAAGELCWIGTTPPGATGAYTAWQKIMQTFRWTGEGTPRMKLTWRNSVSLSLGTVPERNGGPWASASVRTGGGPGRGFVAAAIAWFENWPGYLHLRQWDYSPLEHEETVSMIVPELTAVTSFSWMELQVNPRTGWSEENRCFSVGSVAQRVLVE